jgi:hypothetical protein
MIITWQDGMDLYKSHTLEVNGTENVYTLELCDRDIPSEVRNVSDIINDCLKERDTKTVEVLYSGGLDSELVLRACIKNKIPIVVITMKLYIDGVIINSHDLYYSEKFCREHNLTQKFVELHARPFFENGDHINYLKPYYITSPHVASHFWLIEQCNSFPIMSGDYSWPQHIPVLSPHRLSFNSYSKFMQDNGISGIGNVLNHSLELNVKMIQQHIKNYSDPFNIMLFRSKMYSSLGLGNFEPRFRSFGWEYVSSKWFDRMKYKDELINMYGEDKSTIKWNTKIAEAINGSVGFNDKF